VVVVPAVASRSKVLQRDGFVQSFHNDLFVFNSLRIRKKRIAMTRSTFPRNGRKWGLRPLHINDRNLECFSAECLVLSRMIPSLEVSDSSVPLHPIGFPPATRVYYCCFEGCNYQTIRPGHLRRHERTHTKEKPYCCKYCSYQASRSDHLRRHEKIHERSASKRSALRKRQQCLRLNREKSQPPREPQPTLSLADGGAIQCLRLPVVNLFLSFIHVCHRAVY